MTTNQNVNQSGGWNQVAGRDIITTTTIIGGGGRPHRWELAGQGEPRWHRRGGVAALTVLAALADLATIVKCGLAVFGTHRLASGAYSPLTETEGVGLIIGCGVLTSIAVAGWLLWRALRSGHAVPTRIPCMTIVPHQSLKRFTVRGIRADCPSCRADQQRGVRFKSVKFGTGNESERRPRWICKRTPKHTGDMNVEEFSYDPAQRGGTWTP